MNRTRTSKNAKRLLVWLLVLTMVFGLLPMAAFADETVVEPVVSEEPVQEPEPSSEPSAEPSQEPEAPVEEPVDVIVIDGDELPEDELDTLAAEEGVISEDAIPAPSIAELPTAATDSIRAVMLDCGRKYFTVGEIEALIDAMAKYGYNQLQLSFGNGGCRFLLDEMTLKFKDSDGTTVTINSDSVKTNIKNGNVEFNGDGSTLSQSEMDTIISYAQTKGISIVPMLNMPGHSTAIMYGYSEYQSTKEKTKGNLDVDNLTARNYGYALLSKYVDYFASKGCKYFSFGSDESGFDGNGMTSFVTGCAKIIANAGMRPRAFNDATNVATYPTYVQISYWHQESNSKNPTALANDGHEMLNTHGRWYYVIKNEQSDLNRDNKYWTGTVNSAVTSVELPATKVTGLDGGKWTGLNEYFTADPNYGTVVGSSVGTMFCIWCDASQNAYLTGEQVLSYNENYGALYQLQKLAEHYWGDEIGTDPGTDTDKEQIVNIKVGETSEGRETTAAEGAANTNDANIATASVTKGGSGQPTTKAITSADGFSADKHYIIYSQRYKKVLTGIKTNYYNWGSHSCLKLDGAVSADSSHYWTIAPDGSAYTVKYQGNDTKSLNVGNNTATLGSNGSVSLSYNDGYWNISNNGYYLNNLGNSEKAGGWRDSYASTDDGSKWTIYEIVPGQASSNVLTFTGTGEGTTTASIGGVEYAINVTAPETTETKTLNFGESFTLPAGAEANIVSGGEIISVDGNKITAGQTEGTAVVEAIVKNDGGKVEAKYTYKITVSEINLDDVEPLSVELWITNRYAGGTHNGITYDATETGHIVSVTAAQACGENGVRLENLVPTNGVDEASLPLLFWKGVRLSSDNKQAHTGADQTGAGADFQLIRYYNEAWQYFSNDQWISVANGDQIIAYYMQVYNTSPEIVSAFRDYAGIAGDGGGEFDANWFAGYRGVATAVVYANKSMSPNGDEAIWNDTLLCYYEGANGGGNPGLIKAFDTEDFKITKITITHGVHKDANGKTGAEASKTWNRSTSSVVWEKNQNEAGDEWYNETVIWTDEGHVAGETITLDDSVWGDTWKTSGIGEAFLLLFYVEPVEKETDLQIVYFDDNAKTQIVDPVSVSVKEDVTFLNGLNQTSPVTVGTFILDDNATITNSVGVAQSINKNITIIDNVAAKYRSGIYDYVSADISEDGKTLTLHYDIKIEHKTFVVDFGLPVKGSLGGFGITDLTTVSDAGFSFDYSKSFKDDYGEAIMTTDNYEIQYTLKNILNGQVELPIYVKFGNDTEARKFAVTIIPASNVYYEDGFAKFTNGAVAASTATWKKVGDEASANQALSELGKDPNAYGFDPAYNKDNSATFSMGSAHKVTVTSSMRNGWSELSAWPTAKFSFKGTGFDVISLTNNTSGAILVDVYDSNGNKVKGYFVDNYLGYGFVDGKWTEKATGDNILYQIPVMKVCDLPYDSYNVTITVFYNDAFEHNGDQSYDFWLDAIRVYDPMGKNADYTTDKEGYPQYINLRDQIAASGSNVGIKKTLFIDGNAEAKVADYINLGPNNEVYLANGQAISFKLPVNGKIDKVQIGAKAPNGATELNVNSTNVVADGLKSATEMYYDITSQASGRLVTITNTTGNILSLTNIKITFKQQQNEPVSLETLSNDDAEAAVTTVRALFAAPVDPEPTEPEQPEEPEKTFKPERFETSWSSNVRKGGRAVLTVKASTDVDAIIVDGVTYTKYFTRTERVGRGWNAQRVTYREFVYMMTVNESGTLTVPVVAVSNEQGESSPYETTLTVKPSSPIRDWIGGLFGRWF